MVLYYLYFMGLLRHYVQWRETEKWVERVREGHVALDPIWLTETNHQQLKHKYPQTLRYLLSSLYHSKSASGTASASHSITPIWPRVTPMSLPSDTLGASVGTPYMVNTLGRGQWSALVWAALQQKSYCIISMSVNTVKSLCRSWYGYVWACCPRMHEG